MSAAARTRRQEDRAFKRLFVRFGVSTPQHQAVAMQFSPRGLFISTNRPVFKVGSAIVIEVTTATGTFLTKAVVRHARRVPPQFAQYDRPGMGVEFVDPPEELRNYLANL